MDVLFLKQMNTTDEYTYNPEEDFNDDPFILDMFNMFKSSIIYQLYLDKYLKDKHIQVSFDLSLPLSQRVYNEPRLFETIVCNMKAHPDEIFSVINREIFNNEQVLFDDMNKFKESEFFHIFCSLIHYIEHMPTLDKMIEEMDRKAKMNSDRRKNENIMLINKELIH